MQNLFPIILQQKSLLRKYVSLGFIPVWYIESQQKGMVTL